MQSILTGFAAYSNTIREVQETLSRLPNEIVRRKLPISLAIWENRDIAGYCLVDPILEQIKGSDFILADITRLNFNVVYEIGYAIASAKRVILLQNKSIAPQTDLMRELGLFDTLGWKTYANTDELCNYLADLEACRPLRIPEQKKKITRPFFVIWPSERTEAEIRLLSRMKKQARVGFQQFDPKEDSRLPASRALDEVVNAFGIILPLISSNRSDAIVHNLRCAFVAGLGHGLDREVLLLQAGGEPIPLDYRDAVSFYSRPENIDHLLADFTPKVYERTLQVAQSEFPSLATPIQKLQIGASAAENEHDDLGSYYIQTEEYRRVLRGEIQIVTGRKGSGKTALFYQVRNTIRKDKRNVFLDLNPQGFQLRKFKNLVLDRLEAGTREHTVTAFWEYLLFLELAYKLLEKDQHTQLHNHLIRDSYLNLEREYRRGAFVAEGDFAERLMSLLDGIEEKYSSVKTTSPNGILTRAQLTDFIYHHNIETLKKQIITYLQQKGSVWILFDNIDKGWSAQGVDETDLLSLRCLMEALRKLERDLRKSKIICHGVVFIRNDVYDNLIDSTPDRGKVNRASLDWSDRDLLREMLRRRFLFSLELRTSDHLSFDLLWNRFAVAHLDDSVETSDYLLDRCLMRPRSLLDLLYYCKSHAVNIGHDKIEQSDIKKGEESFSTELVNGISLEIQDILPVAPNSLFAFVECDSIIDLAELKRRMARVVRTEEDAASLLELLLWFGFIGLLRNNLDECYIYSVNYDRKKFKALIDNIPAEERLYIINPAFFLGLEIKTAKRH